MRKLAFLGAFAFVLVASSSARADDKTIVLKGYIIYGHAPHPIAVAEVTKIPMKTTVTELKQPLVQRVEQAVQSNPF